MTEAMISNVVLRLYCRAIGNERQAAVSSAWWRSRIAKERICPINACRLLDHSSWHTPVDKSFTVTSKKTAGIKDAISFIT